MKISLLSLISVCILTLGCHGSNTSPSPEIVVPPPTSLVEPQPNYNYFIEVPQGWKQIDTAITSGLRIRYLFPFNNPQSDNATVNILISKMSDETIHEFTTKNMEYLKTNMPGITILARGEMKFQKGQWFRYTKDQQGNTREVITYLIPTNGFGYIITCGSTKGSFKRYSQTFEKIAQSFKA